MPIYETMFLATMPIYIIAIYLLNRCLLGERIKSSTVERTMYIVYGVGIAVLYLAHLIPIFLLLFNFVAFFALTFNYKADLMKRLRCTILVYSSLFLIEIAVVAVTGYVQIDGFSTYEYSSAAGISMMRVLMLIIASLMYKYKRFKLDRLTLPIYYYAGHIGVLIGTLYLFLMSLQSTYISAIQVATSSAMLFLINGMTLLIDEKVYDMMRVSQEKKLLEQQNEAYSQQLQIMDKALTTVRTVKHDMKNHLLVLKSMHDKGELTAFADYTEKILSQIDGNGVYAKSGNYVVDSIINYKLQHLDGLDVAVEVKVQVPEQTGIEPYDLAVILGNLLDNAITALKAHKGERQLKIAMHTTKGGLVAVIDNTYSGELYIKEGSIQTTKKEKEAHGIGLVSTRQAVERYRGTIEITPGQDQFSVAVLIPYSGF